MLVYILVVLVGYLLGSLPTALLVSRKLAGKDIRELGDGNMGARNTTHVLGWKAGILVAAVDFSKGAIIILLSRKLDLPIFWQLLAGVFSVLGHDYPVFAQFKGGQGMATSLGTMSVLFTEETLIGLLLFGLLYLITRHFDLSAGVGLGSLVFCLWKFRQPLTFIVYSIVLFLTIPIKKYWDFKHRVLTQVHVH